MHAHVPTVTGTIHVTAETTVRAATRRHAACDEQYQKYLRLETPGRPKGVTLQSYLSMISDPQHHVLMKGKVLVDGYSVDVPQPEARRAPADHLGEEPDDCLPHGTDVCKAGHPSLILNEKDMVDRGERAGKLVQAVKKAQSSAPLLIYL
jgi:hypothetical protein